MNGLARLVWLFVLGFALGACRTSPGTVREAWKECGVGMDMLLPPAVAERMELPRTQRFVFPRPIDPVAMPIYPPALLHSRLDTVTVCMEVDVGADGGVIDARRRKDGDCASEPVLPAFVQVNLEAVRSWRYEPAYLCIAPDGSVDDPCRHPRVVEQPTPVRLSYAFRFMQQDGRPQVNRADR